MNDNYKAVVARIDSVTEIPGADKIQVAYVLGEAVIVGKDWGVGTIGLFFPVDCQLSEAFCSENNLHRDCTLNKDNEKTGFFDKNRKVRAQPFMKIKSMGYFTNLESLSFLTNDVNQFKLGDKFDNHVGTEICRKFISVATQKALANANKSGKKKLSTEAPFFHKHVDTSHFKRSVQLIQAGSLITVHSKQHGTSARMTHTKMFKELPKWKQLVNKLALVFPEYKWEYLVGTRNVIRFPTQNEYESFHGSEQFRFDAMEKVKPFLEKGMTVYGELLGYANSKPIMGVHDTTKLKDKKLRKKYGDKMVYRYGCQEGETSLMIYRITYTTDSGNELDFTPWQVTEWCERHGLTPSLMVTEPFIFDGNHDGLTYMVEAYTEREDCLCEDYVDPTHISEGVVVRVDYKGQVPKFYKSKSFYFSVLEGFLKEDDDFVDEEDLN